MPFDSLNLPSIITKNLNVIRKDIQGREILISPTTEAKLPNPLQPSIIYMENSLPTQLQSMIISKPSSATDCFLNSKIRQLLPPPFASDQRLTPVIFADEEEEQYEEDNAIKLNHQNATNVELEEPESSFTLQLDTSSVSSASSSTSSSSKRNNSKQYICSLCPKKFMRPSSLKIHIYSHTGEKPFNCSYPGCRRKFSVQSNMRRHLRVHSN
ncbi:unnamed protein product [Mucor hiemalis]